MGGGTARPRAASDRCKIFHGTATSTRKDGTKEATEAYVGDGVNEKTVELRREHIQL